MAKKSDVREKIVYKEPEKKRDIDNNFAIIVGIIGISAGIYPLLKQFGVHNYSFEIPSIAIESILVIVSIYLIIEAGKRMAMIRAKRKYDHLLHQH